MDSITLTYKDKVNVTHEHVNYMGKDFYRTDGMKELGKQITELKVYEYIKDLCRALCQGFSDTRVIDTFRIIKDSKETDVILIYSFTCSTGVRIIKDNRVELRRDHRITQVLEAPFSNNDLDALGTILNNDAIRDGYFQHSQPNSERWKMRE